MLGVDEGQAVKSGVKVAASDSVASRVYEADILYVADSVEASDTESRALADG